MGRGKSADVDGVINAAEGIYLSVSGETDKKQEDKLKNMIRKAEELKDKLQKSRDDLNVSLRGQVISLEEGVEELCQDIKDELDEDRKRNSCLKAIPAIRRLSSVCGPVLSIFGIQYFSMSNISGFIVCFLGLSLIFPRFSFLTEFLKMWNGGVEKRLKELAPRLKAYEERLKEIQETRQRVREANTFDVGPILRGFPDAKKFWIDQFGADKRKVPTTRFIEVLLDWRNKMDVSRGVRVEPLPEKERETLYCQVGKVIDTNHDGSVSPTELANILAYFGPLHHSVIKMRSLVDFDDDGEPRRQPWFIWKDVGKDQFTKKLEEAKYSCFVVRASESVRNAFVVQRRIFKLNEEQPELEKTLVLNSQAEMWEWGQEELLQWGLDRLYLEQYKPGPAKSEQKCGPKRFDMKRKDSLKRVIKSYLLNNIKQLINLGVEGPDWARVSVKNVWDLATQEGLHELSTEDKQGTTKQDQKDLKSVVNELKKTNKRKKSLRVTDFRIAFTPEVWKKEFTSIDKDVEELLKELKGLQVPPDAKEFRESVREIQREIKDVVEYRQKYYPSEGGEIKETSCDELIKYKQADEKESPNEEEIERRESEMSLVQSNIEKLKVKSQLLTQTIRVKSKTKEILKNLKPLTEDKDLNKLSEAAVEASGLLKQIRWMSAEGVAAWAHDLFGGKSVFTLYLSDACSLVELKEQVEKVALLEAPGADPADVFSRWCKSGPRQPEASRAVRTDGVLVNHHVVLEMWNVPGLKSKLFDARSKRRRQAIEGTHVCALVVGSSFLSQPNSLPLLGKLRREILNAKIPGTDGMEFALLITKQKSDIPVSAETLSKFCRDQSVAGWVSVSVGGTRTTLREALRYIASVGVKVHEARTGLKEGSFSAGIAAATRRRRRLRERLQQSLARVLAAGDGTTSMALPRTFTGREPVIVLPHVLSGRKSKKKKRRASVPASARTSARASARRGSPLLNDTDPADHSVVIANTVRQFLPSSSPSSYGPRTSLTPVPGTNPVPSAAKKPRAVKVRASKSLKTTRPRARPARKKVSGTACASSRSTKTGSQNESASTVGRPRSTEKRRVGADTAGVRRASTGARSRHRRKNSGLKSSAGDSLTIQRSRSDSGIARLATVGKLPEVRRTVVRGGEKRRSSLLSTPQAETSSSSQAPGPQASTPPARQSVAPTLALGGMAAGQANDAATLRDADSKGVGASTEEEAEMEELDALLRLQWSRVVHTVRSVRADHKQFKTLIDQFQNPTWRSIAPRLFNALRGGEPNVAFTTYRGAVMALTGTNGEAPRLIFRVFDERARGYLTREDAREAYEEFFLSSSVAEKLLKLGDDLDKIRNRLRGSIEKAVDRMFGRLDPMRTGFIREEAFIDSYAEVDVLPSFETAALRG